MQSAYDSIHNFFFLKKQKKGFAYNNFCLSIIFLLSLVIIIPLMWCFGVITLYIVDRGYDFSTGECDSGIFCNNNQAYCSADNTLYFVLGCTGFGIMSTAFVIVNVIVICIVFFLIFKLIKNYYLCFKRRKELKGNDEENL